MKIDADLKKRIDVAFKPLNKVAAAKAFPAPLTLSGELERKIPNSTATTSQVSVGPDMAALFAAASVEMWHRSIHSFLISASLTEASPVWASVSGYYSSHYSIRAFAHILGYFQLYRKKRIVSLEPHRGSHICSYDKKLGNDREHKFYWKIVKKDPHFNTDPLFTENDSELDESDTGHRDRGNYGDLIGKYPIFQELDIALLRNQVRYISQIQFDTPPIPCRSRFPDIDSVQLVAYHRIVKYRRFLDEILGGNNRFWTVHRDPSWAKGIMDYQLIEQGSLGSLNN